MDTARGMERNGMRAPEVKFTAKQPEPGFKGERTSIPDENAELVLRFAAGDQEAARLLTKHLVPVIVRQAWRLLSDREEAEDIAQEVMMKLWRQAAAWRTGEAKVTTWTYRVTRNLCIDRLRKRGRTEAVSKSAELEERLEDGRPSALETIVRDERDKVLAKELSALPARQREALILRHFEELSNPAIAERLECSIEAVESLLSRGRKRLATRLSRSEAMGEAVV